MARASGEHISLKVFMWFFFIVIGLFLAFWLFSLYNQYIKSGEIEEGTAGTLNCNAYTYRISAISYAGNQLNFTIANTLGDQIRTIEVMSETDKQAVDIILSAGREKKVSIDDFKIETNFVVYPEGCLRYNSKEFTMREGGWTEI